MRTGSTQDLLPEHSTGTSGEAQPKVASKAKTSREH
ncbi:unnamed protein product [Gulo gulo]|uniref:Uncharacterized protein n=1 Tax=Gulo gulo TaxID=48420 RepID=A0A9X9LQE0_GULGU|nr:unnamed protein product [Gulo gulo]